MSFRSSVPHMICWGTTLMSYFLTNSSGKLAVLSVMMAILFISLLHRPSVNANGCARPCFPNQGLSTSTGAPGRCNVQVLPSTADGQQYSEIMLEILK